MGPHIEKEHCFIQNLEGIVTLVPSLGAMCAVQGIEVTEPTKLSQGKLIVVWNLYVLAHGIFVLFIGPDKDSLCT